MTKEKIKAMFSSSIVRQIIVADVLYKLASDLSEIYQGEETDQLRNTALRYVNLMATYMRRNEQRVMLQAAITDSMETLTADTFDTAMNATQKVLRDNGIPHPDAGAIIFALQAISGGSIAALDCVSKRINQTKLSTTIKSIRPIELDQKARRIRRHLLDAGAQASNEEMATIISSMIAYTDQLLSLDTITRAIEEAHETLKGSRDDNILHLPIKSKWYDMIENGEKTEEYRELSVYWRKRLFVNQNQEGGFKDFSRIRFRYGYTKRTLERKIVSISIGLGKPEWGAPSDRAVFIIKFQ